MKRDDSAGGQSVDYNKGTEGQERQKCLKGNDCNNGPRSPSWNSQEVTHVNERVRKSPKS